MSEWNRRDLLAVMAALAITKPANAAEAQAPQSVPGASTLGKTRVYTPQLVKQPNGSERWPILSGTLTTGETVGMHESVVPAGTPAPAPHKILHSELVVVAEGTLELWADGETSRAPAGSVLYIAYGATHFVRNVGDGTARYFVWQVGGDTK